MTTTLTDTHTLDISGMTGDVCIQKVTAALRAVPGITPQSVKVGSATITSDSQAKTDSAIAAVVSAGFKATERDAHAVKTGSCDSGPMAGSCGNGAKSADYSVKATPIPTSPATSGGAAPYAKSDQPAVTVPAKTPQPAAAGASPTHI